MTSEIVRTPTRVAGGITEAERARLREHADLWTERIMRTDPIDPDKAEAAIRALYRAAGLDEPRNVVIVPSPRVMAIAGSTARWLVDQDQGGIDAGDIAAIDATNKVYRAADYATDAATSAEIRAATDAETVAATWAVTRKATYYATDDDIRAAFDDRSTAEALAAIDAVSLGAALAAIDGVTDSVTDAVTRGATIDDPRLSSHLLDCWGYADGGNHDGQLVAEMTAMRDVLGLRLPEYERYAAWEQAAIHGSWRYLHPQFAIVSDFPSVLRTDDEHRPHCETGPSHVWPDGWSLWHWHGVRVEQDVIEAPERITDERILSQPSGGAVRAAMIDRRERARAGGGAVTDTIGS